MIGNAEGTALPEAETVGSPTSSDRAPSAWWGAARLWVVVACFIGVGILRSAQVDIPFRDPHGAYLLGRVTLTFWIFLALVILDGLLRTGRPRTWSRVWSTIRTRWTPGRLGRAWAALLAYHLTYFTYHNLKSWDVFNAPRDAMLTGWDRWLFLGHSPAVLLHDLLGQHAAAWVLMVWYETFPTLAVVAFPAAVVLTRRMRDAYAGIAAFVWVWILGTATYYAIPSLGPFHAEPGDFSGLPHMMIQDTQDRYMAQREYLLAHPHANDAFAQVSAFASLHVGVTATILGLAWWHRMRRTTVVLAVFLAGTMVATVYLGWHFAVDIPAGLAIAALAWVLGPLTVGVRQRPQRRKPHPAASRPPVTAEDFMPSSPATTYRPSMRCLIVVPTYNEASTVRDLLDTVGSLRGDVPGVVIDVLVVDDNSPDQTQQLVRSHAGFGRWVHLLARAAKDGLGAAYRAGFAAAVRDGYDLVVQMDADGSHPTTAIPPLLALLDSNDVAVGSRYVPGGRTENWPTRRKVLAWAANTYARTILRLDTRDTTSGFRSWRAEAIAVAGILETTSSGYGFQVEDTWRCERRGLRLAELPITFTERAAGVSKKTAAVAREAAFLVLRWRLRELTPGKAAPAAAEAAYEEAVRG